MSRGQAEDKDGLHLADSVATIHRLKILMGVPITRERRKWMSDNRTAVRIKRVMQSRPVVNDDCVCSRKVDPEASRPSGEEEEPGGGVVAVEVVDALLPLLPGNRPVNSASPVAFLLKIAVEEIEHLCHLGKDEDLVLLGMKSVEEAVEELHLAALSDNLLRLRVFYVGREGTRNEIRAVEERE